jgi:hypothetical protein
MDSPRSLDLPLCLNKESLQPPPYTWRRTCTSPDLHWSSIQYGNTTVIHQSAESFPQVHGFLAGSLSYPD